ncbi:D-glycero-beta-D-manno-heptose 1,7-bisphosphate 7-phosphatase [Achromobacter sp. LC458]|uniref:D,D-heptose 1,7-bisphosphate phosphatase n=1 Tax=Achromobacter spanius TaxID=217203 RepID=A0A2S5GSK9_9BURK|nr:MULTISPECIES: D-glycero-beta-D-manno-heptose 1,7-bisphosphate 7-phosphatase [Achromobacter]MDX3986511.1 D-glycero-beta-D-manno-heptose 1,7-bisphosphate 7-phosphatase [Achromobacter sp.]PPA76080.1 D-glycero-beta-D-manno-heptose-1,7-bisphosphate 7-phosphatase [Achromobacter spanius]QYJ22407.1 D-glycero-beta-D-manno-heptose 1,7-bisphosphate 7-phosphatase [Achromobacter sp. ES-001]TRM50858.1 D-glycero-beta-D-manno-heptose 1,7-bisphosphate 7-phosphatase [Achromobacter sp. LC458]HCQ48498.1 D-glyc
MKLIILDRDGVINQDSDAFVKNPDEWIALPGSLQAIARLTQADWKVVVASNQSGLARGLFDMDTLTAIHTKMRRELAAVGGTIDAVFLCPHGPDDNCTCRKPRPGLFEQIGHRYDISLAGVPAVGDSLRDLQASAAVGCAPWLVHTGNGKKTLAKGGLPENTRVCEDLSAVVDILLQDN